MALYVCCLSIHTPTAVWLPRMKEPVHRDWAVSNSSYGQVWRCLTTRAVICSLEGPPLIASITRTRLNKQDLHKIREQHSLD